MKLNISINSINNALKQTGRALDGFLGSDTIGVDVNDQILDGIRHRSRFEIHRFDSELYNSLENERKQVAAMLAMGHVFVKKGLPLKADNVFKKAFELEQILINARSYQSSVIEGNALLNEGINAMTTLICGGAETAFNNANAQLGVGTGTPTNLAGTCTFTQWSATVTGSGTAFDTALAVGDWIRAATSTVWYRVKSIASATSLTLEKAFEEATETGVTGMELDATSTDLVGTVVWKGMDTSYPTFGSGQNMIYQSVFGTSEANQAWENFGVRNGATANKNMNLRFDSQGTKTAGQTWTLNLQIDLF